jgi:hypothetical protein
MWLPPPKRTRAPPRTPRALLPLCPHRKVEAVSEEAAFIASSLDRYGGREARRRREQVRV